MQSKQHLNEWINHIRQAFLVAGFESEPVRKSNVRLKCLPFSRVRFKFNEAKLLYLTSKSGRGRSGTVPTALPAAHGERWGSAWGEVVTVCTKESQTRLNSETQFEGEIRSRWSNALSQFNAPSPLLTDAAPVKISTGCSLQRRQGKKEGSLIIKATFWCSAWRSTTVSAPLMCTGHVWRLRVNLVFGKVELCNELNLLFAEGAFRTHWVSVGSCGPPRRHRTGPPSPGDWQSWSATPQWESARGKSRISWSRDWDMLDWQHWQCSCTLGS